MPPDRPYSTINHLAKGHAVWKKASNATLLAMLLLLGTLTSPASFAKAVGWVIKQTDNNFFTGMTDHSLHLNTNKHLGTDTAVWLIETVDSDGNVGLYTSMAIDGSGYPHVSYYDQTNSDLKYAYQDASGWHIEIVDDSYVYPATETSIAVDEQGYPHISYCSDYDLKYAYRDASGWYIQTVEDSGETWHYPWVGRFSSLRFNQYGHPRISYADYSYYYTVKYAVYLGFSSYIPLLSRESQPLSHRDRVPLNYNAINQTEVGPHWHIETVDDTGAFAPGPHTALSLDGYGHPHIIYASRDNLKHAYQSISGWQVETVDPAGGIYISVDMDQQNRLHVSYKGYGGVGLKYAFQDAVDWNIETVDSGVGTFDDVDESTSLALDGVGYPHISYYDPNNDDLKYAYRDATGWHIEIIDSEGGKYTSLAVDESDCPHVSFYGEGHLKYATVVGCSQ